MVTRNDVAKLAGTSPAVVSYVVNGGPRPVAPTTRVRVQAAIDQLAYRPNGVARSLRLRRTGLLGLIVPDNSNPYFAELAREIEEQAFAADYLLLLGNSTDRQERQAAYVCQFLESRVEGLIIIGPVAAHTSSRTSHLPPTSNLLDSETGPPVVMVDRYLPSLRANYYLGVDNGYGGYIATQHLLEHGYTSVSCLAGPPHDVTADERRIGWDRALCEARVRPSRQHLIRSAFNRHDAYKVLLGRLHASRHPRALFIASDEQAIGALRAVQEVGLRVPEDIAFVSFDGITDADFTNPRLTTVAQPIPQLAQTAVQLLLDPEHVKSVRASDTQSSALRAAHPLSRSVLLPVQLKLGHSCGC